MNTNRTKPCRGSIYFIFLSLIFLSPFSLAMTLPNGGVVAGDISFIGEVDQFTFTASAGHTVYLRVADTESTPNFNSGFFPQIELLDPNGVQITSGSGSLVGDIARFLVVSGQYTVRVRDVSSGNDETGSYNLYYARAPGANDDGVLPNGGKVSGEIELGDIDSYRFTANAGQTVYLRIADTETTEFISSDFFPSIRILTPSGALLTSGSGALVGDLARTLVESGTYTVIVTDESSGEDATGSYDLFYARAPGANDDGVLPNGGKVSGEIELGDIDSYRFNASAGQTVYLRVADTETTEFISSDFFPSISVLTPSGAVLTSGSGALVGDVARTLVESGTYTVIITDESSGEDATGSYDLFYARAPGANNDGVLLNGGKVSGEITLGDLDSYRFTANAGETVYLRVADTETTEFISSDFFPFISISTPSGAVLTSGSGALVGDVARTLAESGTYIVIVTDESSGEDATGSYDLFYAKAPGASNDGCIADGEQQLGFIELGDIDSLNFEANAGISLFVSVTDLDGGGFFPFISLLDPSGAVVTSSSGSSVAQINRTLSTSGLYTLIILDESSGEDATGNYRIEISGVSVSCPPPPTTQSVEVELVYSCLAGRGRFDLNIVNTETAVSTYTFNLQGQLPRTRTVAFEDWGRIPITGRLPGSYTAEVLRDGVPILSDTVQLNCSAQVPPVSSPEVTVVNSCVGGNGFVLFQMVNPTNSSRTYVIEFENVSNRATTAAAYGQAIRGTFGRPDGTFAYKVRTGSTTVREGAIEVDCD